MNRTRKLFAVCALALAGTGLVACGGDDGDEDPAEVLREAAGQEVQYDSGVINFSLDGSLEGSTSGSIDADVTGPFQAGSEGTTPEVQLDATASVQAEGEQIPVGSVNFDFDGGFALADDSLFVTYQDTTYEASPKLYNQISPLIEAAESADDTTQDPESTEALIDSLENLENEGTEEIDGVEATHVSGDLDFASLVEQQEGAAALPEEATQIFENISMSLDFFVAEEDQTFRQVDVGFSVGEIPQLQAQGVDGLDFTFSAGISDPNSEQTIEAPTDTQPLDELLQQFGTSESELIRGLEGGLVPSGIGGIPGAGGTGTPGGTAADPEVQECIANAQDADAITECLQ